MLTRPQICMYKASILPIFNSADHPELSQWLLKSLEEFLSTESSLHPSGDCLMNTSSDSKTRCKTIWTKSHSPLANYIPLARTQWWQGTTKEGWWQFGGWSSEGTGVLVVGRFWQQETAGFGSQEAKRKQEVRSSSMSHFSSQAPPQCHLLGKRCSNLGVHRSHFTFDTQHLGTWM